MSTVATAVLLLMLAAAIREDAIRNRIPNALTLGGGLAGIGFAATESGFHGAFVAVQGVVVGFGVLLPFYLLRGMGAGDVKLMSAAGAFLGPTGALIASVTTLIGGALIAVAIILLRLFGPKLAAHVAHAGRDSVNLTPTESLARLRKEKFAYALPIAIGVIAALWFGG